MSDGLHIGGEATAVVTEQLRACAYSLELRAEEAAALVADVALIDDLLGRRLLAGAPYEAVRAENALDEALTRLRLLEFQARSLSVALAVAAEGYALAERAIERMIASAVDEAGALFGALAPLCIPGLLVITARLVTADPDDRNRLLSDPRVVSAIRLGIMAADDAVMARLGLPRGSARLLGDQGLKLTGIPFVATLVTFVARGLGMFPGEGVQISHRQQLPTGDRSAPTGFSERLARVPDPGALGGAQVVIERYRMPDGEIRAEVYIAGTVDFDPYAEGEPWDSASNLSNAIGPGGGSYQAVVAAMAEAGMDSRTPVQFTGYSQGAGTAAQLAASGSFDTRGVVTFGGPTGQIPIPETVPTVIVEHSDDLVAALGGAQDNRHAVIVERWASEGADFSEAELLPGHQIQGYRETSRLMDESPDPAVLHVADQLAGFTAGGVLLSRVAYEADRVSADRVSAK